MTRRTSRASAALGLLTDLATLLGSATDGRRAIVYIGEGIDISLTSPDAPTVVDGMREFISAATRSAVRVYTIDPRGLQSPELGLAPAPDELAVILRDAVRNEYAESLDAIADWAEESGGLSISGTNDVDSGLRRIAESDRQHYALGYYSDAPAGGARYHRVEVKVRRPGVQVRARRGYLAPRSPRPAGRGTAGNSPASPLDVAFRLPLDRDGLRLDVVPAPFLGDDGKTDVVLAVTADGRDVPLVEDGKGGVRGEVEFRAAALTTRGDEVHARRLAAAVAFPAGRTGDFLGRGLFAVERLAVPPGPYVLRVAAASPGGERVGVVNATIQVEDLRATPVLVSGILVGSAKSRPVPSLEVVERFRRWLPNGPTPARRFGANDELRAFAEVYENEPTGEITVTARCLDARDSVVLEDETLLGPGRSSNGARPYVARIPTSELEAGTYRLQLIVRTPRNNKPIVRQATFEISRK